MYYIIYKTINLVNGKYYIGHHRTDKLDDGYLGSGVALKNAIKKYGKDAFTRVILEYCSDEESMWERENALVDKDDPLSYNMTDGGRGGWGHVDNSGDNNPMKRQEVTELLVSNRRKNGSYHTPAMISASKANALIAAEKNRGAKRSDEFREKMKILGAKVWNDKEKMRDILSSTFSLISPDNIEYTTNRLQEFCVEHNIPYTTIWNISTTGTSPKRGKAKGWKCKKI